MSNQWSPGEFQPQSASMDIGDEVGVWGLRATSSPMIFPLHSQIAAMLGHNQLEAANVESLLGLVPGQQHRQMAEQPLQQLDLSFMDTFQQQPHHPAASIYSTMHQQQQRGD
jgi:hypothetical protein